MREAAIAFVMVQLVYISVYLGKIAHSLQILAGQ